MKWSLRVPQQGWLVPVILGIGGLALSVAFMINVVEEYDGRSILRARGQQVTATVTAVTETNRSNESLEVRAALADGRPVDVDLVESNQFGAKVGQPIQITIDPADVRLSVPTDLLNNEQSFASKLAATTGPTVVFAIGCFILALIKPAKSPRRADREAGSNYARRSRGSSGWMTRRSSYAKASSSADRAVQGRRR